MRADGFELSEGDWVDLEGPSGSGKTTLLLALARLLPWQGQMWLRGAWAREVPPPVWRSRVTYVSQAPVALDGSVGENLQAAFGLTIRSDRRRPDAEELRSLLQRLGMGGIDLGASARRLSGGELARLALARARLTGPEILLLDEPDAMLDAASAAAVAEELARFVRAGGAVVRASHHGGTGATRRWRIRAGYLEEG